MNSNLLQRGSMPLSYNKSHNNLFVRNSLFGNGNINTTFNNSFNTINNPQIQNVKPKPTLASNFNPENLNSPYNSIVNITRIGAIKNAKSFNEQSLSSKKKMRIIKINKSSLSSSGTLISSKKSKKFDKVLKNGKEIENIDINGDPDNPKNDSDNISTNSNRNRFKSFDKNKNISNEGNFGISYGASNINNINSINNSQSLENTGQSNSHNTFKMNPLARFINYIIDKINPNINKNPKLDPYYNRHNINRNQYYEPLDSTYNNINLNNSKYNVPLDSTYNENKNNYKQILNPANPTNTELNNNTLKNGNYLKDKSSEVLSKNKSSTINNQNKVASQSPSINSIKTPSLSSIKSPKTSNKPFDNESNLNSTDKKTQFTKREDTNTKKSESKTSTSRSFPFQPLKDILISPKSNISINKQNLIYPSDNYIATHLGEYLKNETQPNCFSVDDIVNQTKGKAFKCYSQLSQAGMDAEGKLKTNQDTPLISISLGGVVGFNMFGVLDGHGPDGHFVSKYCRDYFIRNMIQYTNVLKIRKGIYTAEGVYLELKGTKFDFIVGLFTNVDGELASQRDFDFTLSGTTCNIIFQFNNHLICFSVGDSRSILIYENGQYKGQDILPLSTDHKPDLPGEIDRIRLCGGEVQSLKDIYGNKLGPSRVFKLGSEYPGLAMSRSLGDLLAKEVGVSPVPQIIEYDINLTTKYFIICSDGVWEFSSNEEIRDIGNMYYSINDVAGFCSQVLKLAMNLWAQFGVVRDDITVISVFF